MGGKLFKTWYPTNTEVYKFLQQSAKKGAWYFLLRRSNSVTNGVLLSVGMFEVPVSDGNHLTTEDIRERIDIAITRTFFPYPIDDSVISFEGYEQENFLPLTNKLHRPFVKMWYDPNIRSGSKFKKENMPNGCNP